MSAEDDEQECAHEGMALPQCDLEALQEHISTVEGVLHSLQDSIQGESQSRVSFYSYAKGS